MRPRFEEVSGWTVTTPSAFHRSTRASAREPERRGLSVSASQAIQLSKSWVSGHPGEPGSSGRCVGVHPVPDSSMNLWYHGRPYWTALAPLPTVSDLSDVVQLLICSSAYSLRFFCWVVTVGNL
jgi:hypothetical protein